MFTSDHIILTKIATRLALRNQGKGFSEINHIMSGWDDGIVSMAVTLMPPEHAAVGAIGDGTIIKAFWEFIKSPAGQALIAILIRILTGGAI